MDFDRLVVGKYSSRLQIQIFIITKNIQRKPQSNQSNKYRPFQLFLYYLLNQTFSRVFYNYDDNLQKQEPFEMKSNLDMSSQLISEFMSTKILSKIFTSFRSIKSVNAKDVSCIEVHNNTLFVGTNQSKVFVFDLEKGKTQEHELLVTNQRSFYPHCTLVHFIVASAAFIVVVPLEEQQLIRIWNRQTLQILHGYKGHAKQITSVIFLRDKQHLASSSYDGTVRIWKISENFELDNEIRKYSSKYPLLTLIQLDSESVVIGGDECFITIWNWSKDTLRHKSFAHPGSVINLSFCQPQYLYSMGGDSRVCLWRVQQFQRTSPNLSQIINSQLICSSEQKINLVLMKQSSATVSNHVFTMNISNHELLAIDSKGNCFFMNRNLEVISSQLKMNYSEYIRSAKIWQNHLLVVTEQNGRGQLKQVAGQFEEMVNRPRPQIFELVTKIVKIEAAKPYQRLSVNDQSGEIIIDNTQENQ